MRDDSLREMNVQWERLTLPLQRLTAIGLNNVERLADFQLSTLQSYNRFTLERWRDAMEIRDVRDMREFMDKQTQAVQELGRRFTEDLRELMSMGQDITQQLGRAAQRGTERMAEAGREAAAAGARAADTGERAGRRAQ